jgi:beta-fructofuranosidase
MPTHSSTSTTNVRVPHSSSLDLLTYPDNPNNTVAGNQHWGHATSRDLYHWENQQIAIFPANSTEGIFTGSAIVDVNNTSGFFPNQTNGVIAIYTLNTPYQQTQNLAYSIDGGYTFTKYGGNPVLEAGSLNFRDPKVIWYAPTRKWVMVVSYTTEYVIGIFTSNNTIHWTHASNFSHHGLLGSQYECPNMVEMPMKNATDTMYLMYISINPGAPLGGSISQYFPGTFNGTHFTAVDGAARIADFGKDNYAGQFFYGIPGGQPQISLDWASNWEYTDYVPTGPLEGWQSAMSLPRTNYLANVSRMGYDLIRAPYDMSAVMPSRPLVQHQSLENGTLLVDFSHIVSNAVYLEMNITSLNSTALSNTASANFTFLSSISGESLTGGQFLAGGSNFFLNRGLIRGFDNPYFTDKFSAYPTFSETWRMSAVLDRSIFEVFLLGGANEATISIFPEYPLDTLIIKIGGLNMGAKTSVAAWGLESGWRGYENTSGTVVGNVTMEAKWDRLGYMEF